MTRTLSRLLGGALALLSMLGIAALSYAPSRSSSRTLATIRLAWQARPERVETCRRLSAEEQARLPAHMRQEMSCEGFNARYQLRVALDGAPVLEDTIRGSGLRHDRPIYLLRDVPVARGAHHLVVSFDRIDRPSSGDVEDEEAEHREDSVAVMPGRARREAEERERRRLEAVPSALRLEQDVELLAGQVLLVTYDPEGRRLAAVTPPDSQP